MKRGIHRSWPEERLLTARNFSVLRGLSSVVFLLGASLALSACSLENPLTTQSKITAPVQSAAKIAPSKAPPSAMDTFRAMAKPTGLRFAPLFTEPVADDSARMQRIEEAVQTLRNDLDTLVPSMVRLVAVEKDMKDLVQQLQTLTDVNVEEVSAENINQISDEGVVRGTESVRVGQTALADGATSSSSVTPEAASKGKPPEGAASPYSESQASALQAPVDIKPSTPSLGEVRGVRLGDHMDKTRIVLDVSAKVAAEAAVSANGKQLIVSLPGLSWTGKASWEADRSQLVSGWRFADGKLYVDLLYKSSVKGQSTLPPNGTPNYRLVIDLFSDDIHQ